MPTEQIEKEKAIGNIFPECIIHMIT